MGINDLAGKRVHFIGIGGISMSGLAQILLGRGCTVTGSDQADGPLVARLRALGATVFIGQKAGQHAGADAVVVTSAIAEDNPELQAARAAGVPILQRAQLLGSLMTEYRCAVGVSGTHGKTTATSILATLLLETGLDPTLHIGGVLPLIDGAVRAGGHDLFITEACEYRDNFLLMNPTVAVILNIDLDHLDYFRDIDQIAASFAAFAARVPTDGWVVGNGDDPRVAALLAACGRKTVSFGLGEGNDWRAVNIAVGEDGCCRFTVLHGGEPVGEARLAVPGRHNVMNALAALAAARICGAPVPAAIVALSGYSGALRRFERLGSPGGVTVIHDYAHHPTEVKATLATARGTGPRRLWCVFQPHTYTRTRALLNEFAACFDDADELILLPIYAAREPDPGDISSGTLADAVAARPGAPRCRSLPGFEEAEALLRSETRPGDLALVLGAGTVEDLARSLAREG